MPASSPISRPASLPPECGGHGGPPPGIVVPHAPDVPLQGTGGDQAEQRVLRGPGRPVAQGVPGRGQPRGQPGRGGQPADPQRRGEDLRRRSQVHHDLGVQAEQGRQRRDVVAELAVVVVLHDERAGVPGPGGQRPPARHRQPAAQRILVRRRGIDQPQPVRQRVHPEATGVHRARHDPQPVRGEDGPGGGIPGFLDAHPVPRPQQRGEQAEAPGNSPGHHELAGGAVHAPAAPQVPGEGGAQIRAALRIRQVTGRPRCPRSARPGATPRGRSPRSRRSRAAGRSSRPRRGAAARPRSPAAPGARLVSADPLPRGRPGAPSATNVPEPCRPSTQPSANNWA